MTAPAEDTGARGPLSGRSVLVTRTREQAAGLAAPLERLGAEVLFFPVIEVTDPVDLEARDSALRRIGEYDWLVLTSTNGVDRLFDRLAVLGIDPGVLAGVRVAVVGSATAKALRERGVEPDLVPHDFRAEGLVSELPETGVGIGTKVLIARAEEAREILPEQLRALGAEVDVVVSYRVVPADPDPEIARRLVAGEVDIATFASGGTFRHFLDALRAAGLDEEGITRRLALASIGPVTTAAIRSAGYEVAVEARESTMESLSEAIAASLSPGTRPAGGAGS